MHSKLATVVMPVEEPVRDLGTEVERDLFFIILFEILCHVLGLPIQNE